MAAADRRRGQRQQERERGDPYRMRDEPDAAAEDRDRREQSGDDLGGTVASRSRRAQRIAAARALRVRGEVCGPPRWGLRGGRRVARNGGGRSGSGSGTAGKGAGSGGAGSALIAQ